MNGPPQKPQLLWGEEEETERNEACPQGGIHVVQFFPTTRRSRAEFLPTRTPATFVKVDETFIRAPRIPL